MGIVQSGKPESGSAATVVDTSAVIKCQRIISVSAYSNIIALLNNLLGIADIIPFFVGKTETTAHGEVSLTISTTSLIQNIFVKSVWGSLAFPTGSICMCSTCTSFNRNFPTNISSCLFSFKIVLLNVFKFSIFYADRDHKISKFRRKIKLERRS